MTDETAARIAAAVRAGNYIETAGALVGVSKQALYKWLRRGARAREGLHREFVDAVVKALAEAEDRMLAVVEKAASGYPVERVKETIDQMGGVVRETVKTHEFAWQAAAWRLERKHPERWGRRERATLEVTGGIEQKGLVLVVGGTPEQYIAALRKARDGGAPALPDGKGIVEEL